MKIERAIRDAEQYAAQDDVRRRALDVHNEANRCLYRAQQAFNRAKREIFKEEKKQLKADISTLQKLIIRKQPAKMNESDISAIQDAANRLKASSANACRIAGISMGNSK